MILVYVSINNCKHYMYVCLWCNICKLGCPTPPSNPYNEGLFRDVPNLKIECHPGGDNFCQHGDNGIPEGVPRTKPSFATATGSIPKYSTSIQFFGIYLYYTRFFKVAFLGGLFCDLHLGMKKGHFEEAGICICGKRSQLQVWPGAWTIFEPAVDVSQHFLGTSYCR